MERLSRRTKFRDISGYIAKFPPKIRKLLRQVRKTVHESAPRAKEAISYGIPTFRLNGNLVHFAAFKDHISFFPTSSGIRRFRKELSKYQTAAGTIHFPIGGQLPLGLIRRITRFRVKENERRAKKR